MALTAIEPRTDARSAGFIERRFGCAFAHHASFLSASRAQATSGQATTHRAAAAGSIKLARRLDRCRTPVNPTPAAFISSGCPDLARSGGPSRLKKLVAVGGIADMDGRPAPGGLSLMTWKQTRVSRSFAGYGSPASYWTTAQ
jgi:hypothetical protein